MMISSFIVFLGFYVFYFGSLHSLIILLFVELMVLGVFFFLFISSYSWFVCLMFLLIAVCLGAYGVSLIVWISRSKGFNYFFSF